MDEVLVAEATHADRSPEVVELTADRKKTMQLREKPLV